MNERGAGEIKTIIGAVVVIYAIFCAIKLIPAWTSDKEMSKRVGEVLKFAGAESNRWDAKDMHHQIATKAEELGIPITPEEIKVFEDGTKFRAQMSYVREVDLIVYTYVKPVTIDEAYEKY